jgi:serine/threonine protein kinase
MQHKRYASLRTIAFAGEEELFIATDTKTNKKILLKNQTPLHTDCTCFFETHPDSVDLLCFILMGSLGEQECSLICYQVVRALEFLHGQGGVVGNLNAESVFVRREEGHLLVTLAPMRELGCSPIFCAPEWITTQQITASSDRWSLGILCYLLLAGYPPFFADTDTRLFHQIQQEEVVFHPEFWQSMSELSQDFIRKLLVKDPEGRMSLEDALRHPFLTRCHGAESRVTLGASPILRRKSLQRRVSSQSDRTLQHTPRSFWSSMTKWIKNVTI